MTTRSAFPSNTNWIWHAFPAARDVGSVIHEYIDAAGRRRAARSPRGPRPRAAGGPAAASSRAALERPSPGAGILGTITTRIWALPSPALTAEP